MIGDIIGQVLAGIGGITVGLLLVTWAVTIGQTLSSWLRYKRAERAARNCCPACQLEYHFTPLHRGPLMRDARRRREQAQVLSPPASTRPRKPYTRESGPRE